MDGSYYIINIKPGTYTLVVDMIGYKQLRLENVRVSVNRTTTIDANLESTVIQGETVIVEVDAITTKKDQTSTIKNISSDQKTTDVTFTIKRDDLSKTKEIASSNFNDFAQTNALYSPSECPAKNLTLSKLKLNSSFKIENIA